MAPGAEKHRGFILACGHHLGIRGLDEYGCPVDLAMPALEEGIHGHDHVVVLRLAEGAAYGLGYADDFIGVGADTNGFAERIDIGEKFWGEVGAGEGELGASLV